MCGLRCAGTADDDAAPNETELNGEESALGATEAVEGRAADREVENEANGFSGADGEPNANTGSGAVADEAEACVERAEEEGSKGKAEPAGEEVRGGAVTVAEAVDDGGGDGPDDGGAEAEDIDSRTRTLHTHNTHRRSGRDGTRRFAVCRTTQ